MEKLKKYLGFPLDEQYREPVEQSLVLQARTVLLAMCTMIACSQVLMILFMVAGEGGPFATPQRGAYFSLYLSLLIVSLLAGILALVLARGFPGTSRRYLQFVVAYSAFIALWSCGISILDQLSGSGSSVYIYVILTLAAFAMLRPWQAILIFSGSAVLLNIALLGCPGGREQIFSNLVNSTCVVILAVSVSVMLYRYRVFSCYDQIVIGRQYEEIRQVNQELHRQVMEDELTQMNNRRYLEEVIGKQLEESWKAGHTAAGMMVDIDHFKPYNDRYGHQRGDACLQEVARTIMNFVQEEGGSAVRYGGEEFLVCFLDCGRERALELAEKLCQGIKDRHLLRNDSYGADVTASVGLYVAEKSDLAEFVERTDRALYHAKKNGRGRVEIYREEELDLEAPLAVSKD